MNKKRKLLMLLPAMTLPCVASVFYFDLFSDHPLAAALYAFTKFFTLLWPLLGTYLFINAWIPGFSIKDSVHRKAVPLGVVSGVLIVAIMLAGLLTPIGTTLYENVPRIKTKAMELGFLDYYIPFAIFLSFFHSLLEEYFWRFFVFGTLRTFCSFWPAALLGSLAFASHHVVVLKEYFPLPWAFFFGASVAIGGVLWCFLYERQRTLAGAWVSHLIVDVGIMTVGYFVLF